MSAIYTDVVEAAPVSTTTGDPQVLPSNVQQGVFRNWSTFGNGTQHHQRIEASEISEKKLVLDVSAANGAMVSQYLTLALGSADSLYFGCAYKWTDDAPWSAGTASTRYKGIVGWNTGVTAAPPAGSSNTNPNIVSISPAGAVKIGNLSGGAISVDQAIPVNTYVYLEVEIVLPTSTVNVYVNRSLVATGVISGLTAITAFGLLASTGSSDTSGSYRNHYDDIRICDSNGTAPYNARPADFTTYRRIPLLAQTTTNFNPVGGASGLAVANRTTLDGTVYNRSGTSNDVGDLFSLDLSVLDGTESIVAVQPHVFARKSDLGTRAIDVTTTDGTNSITTPFDGLDTTFRHSIAVRSDVTMPDGTTPITPTSLADLRVGYIARSGA
jgi:hypothetical protein